MCVLSFCILYCWMFYLSFVKKKHERNLNSKPMIYILASQGCHNKVSQTKQLKTTEIYFLIVREVTRLKSRCQQGLLPLKPVREHPSCLFLTYGGLLAIFGICWFIDASLRFLSLHSIFLESLFLRGCILIRTPLIQNQESTISIYGPHLNQLYLQWPNFQIKSHSEVLGVRTSTYLWGTQFKLLKFTIFFLIVLSKNVSFVK